MAAAVNEAIVKHRPIGFHTLANLLIVPHYKKTI